MSDELQRCPDCYPRNLTNMVVPPGTHDPSFHLKPAWGTDADDANPKDALGAVKPDLSLVPPASMIHEAMAMENGAKKYGPYNWRSKKVRTTVYIAAALRHLAEYLDGSDFSSDTEPPVHHLAHAKACCGIVLDALETGNLLDDRPKPGAASKLLQPRKAKP